VIKPDVITIWPLTMDFPYWRERIIQNRDKFDQVIVVLTPNSMSGHSERMLDTVPNITILKSDPKADKWYDVAVNMALDKSEAEYVLFTEQDFVYTDDILDIALESDRDLVYFRDGPRPHLCFTLVSREIIEQTEKDFWVRKALDCFDFFMREAITLSEDPLIIRESEDVYHLAGLTQNYRMGIEQEYGRFYQAKKFRIYNKLSLTAEVKQCPRWLQLMTEIEIQFSEDE
jgi:hypothetical protein